MDCLSHSLSFSVMRENSLCGTDTYSPDGQKEGWTCMVPRGSLDYFAWAVTPGLEVIGSSYTVRPGCQCDSLFSWHGSKNCSGESQKDTIMMRKQFCTIYLSLEDNSEEVYPFPVHVRGCISGFDLRKGAPFRGEFHFIPTIRDKRTEFRIPRQTDDDSLTMDIYDSGSCLYTIDLGKAILEKGYDWSEPMLKDINLKVNHSRLQIDLIEEDWETERNWTTVI